VIVYLRPAGRARNRSAGKERTLTDESLPKVISKNTVFRGY
jgi:hypothetical protein